MNLVAGSTVLALGNTTISALRLSCCVQAVFECQFPWIVFIVFLKSSNFFYVFRSMIVALIWLVVNRAMHSNKQIV